MVRIFRDGRTWADMTNVDDEQKKLERLLFELTGGDSPAPGSQYTPYDDLPTLNHDSDSEDDDLGTSRIRSNTTALLMSSDLDDSMPDCSWGSYLASEYNDDDSADHYTYFSSYRRFAPTRTDVAALHE